MTTTLFDDNPFLVLGVPTTASLLEVERAGQRLLGMLELGLAAARTYATPLGTRERTADDVRRAVAELRDPERRVVAELLATDAPREAALPAPIAPWDGALRAFDWGAPS